MNYELDLSSSPSRSIESVNAKFDLFPDLNDRSETGPIIERITSFRLESLISAYRLHSLCFK